MVQILVKVIMVQEPQRHRGLFFLGGGGFERHCGCLPA